MQYMKYIKMNLKAQNLITLRIKAIFSITNIGTMNCLALRKKATQVTREMFLLEILLMMS